MSVIALNLIAIGFYLATGILLASGLRRLAPPHRWGVLLCTLAGVGFHAAGSYALIVQPEGFNFSLFPVLSLIFCFINGIVLASAVRKPVINLFILLIPLSLVAIMAALVLPGSRAPIAIETGLGIHILLSVVAYSLLSIATLQALLLAYQNLLLKQRPLAGYLQLWPPLETMERLLFEVLWAGQILLTLAIASGAIYLEDMFAQHVVHKTVFTLLAWFIYALLLWGRHFLGWRGYTAIRWALAGFTMLMLAFFGSKLVLEFLLR